MLHPPPAPPLPVCQSVAQPHAHDQDGGVPSDQHSDSPSQDQRSEHDDANMEIVARTPPASDRAVTISDETGDSGHGLDPIPTHHEQAQHSSHWPPHTSRIRAVAVEARVEVPQNHTGRTKKHKNSEYLDIYELKLLPGRLWILNTPGLILRIAALFQGHQDLNVGLSILLLLVSRRRAMHWCIFFKEERVWGKNLKNIYRWSIAGE